MNYVGDFLGRLPARPAPVVDRPAMPQGAIRLQSAPPRPPGHPSNPSSVQPGPHPLGPAVDPSLFGNLLNEQATPKPGPPYVPQPAPPNGEGSPGWLPKPGPPSGGVVGPTPPGGQPNPGDGYGGLYPPGTIANNQLSPIARFLLARMPNAV